MQALSADHWRLESFIDALIFELDKAQDTLSLKGINRKLTYTVRDVAVDLNVFPDYSNDELRFAVARPGDNGASRITFQLGSITDRQIKETTREPVKEGDITIDEVDDLEPELKTRLRRVGVNSARDLDRIAERQISLPVVVGRDAAEPSDPSSDDGQMPRKQSSDKSGVSYKKLADAIARARRQQSTPLVKSLEVIAANKDAITIALSGDNLDDPSGAAEYPIAMLNGQDVAARRGPSDIIQIEIPRHLLQRGANPISLAIDPVAVLDFELGLGS